MVKGHMDSIDRTLLRLLETDSRTPLKTLAAEVGLARSSVQARLRKLEDAGIIQAYTVRVRNPDTAQVEAYLWIRTGSATCAAIAPALARLEGVVQCRSISGDRDMVLLVRTGTLEEVAELRNRVADMEGVAAVETHPVLKDWI
jgi:Lrp/AsnC family transcriptional regulator for asnA, asnC and gidA